ncbi:MAG: DNA-deoxyinosine glycosylase [Bacteroidetes bacterium]|nr:DNA-deoxyinosine glycosylase [Bacteroidota bacterium]
MIEKHPFPPFIPRGSKVLVVGSFPGKESTQEERQDDWFYGANRNQFWKLLENVYGFELKTKDDKQKLFEKAKIGITDIIESCKRNENSNSDSNLISKVYNTKLTQIIESNPIDRILFTGKGVNKEFCEHFIVPENVNLITLPSPSPIYRRMSFKEKAENYKMDKPFQLVPPIPE